jgi:hypothetical protein
VSGAVRSRAPSAAGVTLAAATVISIGATGAIFGQQPQSQEFCSWSQGAEPPGQGAGATGGWTAADAGASSFEVSQQ